MRWSFTYGVPSSVAEEAPQPGVLLLEAAVDDDDPDVVLRLQQVVEALREEHERRPVHVLGRPEVGVLVRREDLRPAV
jgi:hypothetical protein